MKWKCLRCEVIFDDSNKKCDCTESPSPWTPYYEMEVIRTEIKSGPRKLKGKWTMILNPEVVHWTYKETLWERIKRFFKI